MFIPQYGLPKTNGRLMVDHTHCNDGYINIKINVSDNKKRKVMISNGSRNMSLAVPVNNTYFTCPLTLGNGKYIIRLYKNITGLNYTQQGFISFQTTLKTFWNPFVYPNGWVPFSLESNVCNVAHELVDTVSSALVKANTLFDYITKNIRYDHIRANKQKTEYFSNPDTLLYNKIGLCQDISVLFAAMLRCLNVPCRVVVGHILMNGKQVAHAWNEVLIKDTWQRYDATMKIVNAKSLRYTKSFEY